MIATGDPNERNAFTMLSAIKEEPIFSMETANMEVDDRELADIELTTSKESPQLASSLNQLIARQYKFLESAREHKTIQVWKNHRISSNSTLQLQNNNFDKFFMFTYHTVRRISSNHILQRQNYNFDKFFVLPLDAGKLNQSFF